MANLILEASFCLLSQACFLFSVSFKKHESYLTFNILLKIKLLLLLIIINMTLNNINIYNFVVKVDSSTTINFYHYKLLVHYWSISSIPYIPSSFIISVLLESMIQFNLTLSIFSLFIYIVHNRYQSTTAPSPQT